MMLRASDAGFWDEFSSEDTVWLAQHNPEALYATLHKVGDQSGPPYSWVHFGTSGAPPLEGVDWLAGVPTRPAGYHQLLRGSFTYWVPRTHADALSAVRSSQSR